MNFVSYCNIWLKCYITFCNIVADGKRCPNVLVYIRNFFYRVSNKLKKNHLFLATYSEINSITISLIVLCFLAAITFSSVFNSSSIVMCNFVSLIFITSFVSCVLYLCYYVFILLCY